jgi:hypothetical protein
MIIANEAYDLEPGTYKGVFEGAVENNSNRGKKIPGTDRVYDAGMEWKWRLSEGPLAGSLATRLTGQKPTKKSGCRTMLIGVMGRAPNRGERVNLQDYVGRSYEITVSVHPEDDAKTIISSVKPLGAEASPASTNAPPAPAATPPGSTNGAATEEWFNARWPGQKGTEKFTRVQLQERLDQLRFPDGDRAQLDEIWVVRFGNSDWKKGCPTLEALGFEVTPF